MSVIGAVALWGRGAVSGTAGRCFAKRCSDDLSDRPPSKGADEEGHVS